MYVNRDLWWHLCREHSHRCASASSCSITDLDPLNHLQLELIRAYRGGQTDERTVRGIHLTINGLSHGLRSEFATGMGTWGSICRLFPQNSGPGSFFKFPRIFPVTADSG